MYYPTTRVLTVLELLQSRPQISGVEIARHLEVNTRTVRRYITMLQDLGIPVESDRGRYGAYRLTPGFKLPPLMFSSDEALQITLGLLVSGKLGLTTVAAESALSKLSRVMPQHLARRLDAVRNTLIVNLSLPKFMPAGEIVVDLCVAIAEQRTISIRYQAWNGDLTERNLNPYGIVLHDGFWYAVGYCHLRDDIRTFRLDRIASLELQDTRFVAPAYFDPLAEVMRALARTPGIFEIEVILHTSLEQAQRLIPPSLGLLKQTENGIRFTCYFQRLEWITHFLAGLDVPMTLIKPLELRNEMQKLAQRIERIRVAAL
ncbi:MAG: YafY family protein [Anaerolineae bacterium]